MSKSICKLLCIALAMCMILSLAACGKKAAEPATTAPKATEPKQTKVPAHIAHAGTYVLTSAEYDGTVMGKEELDLLGLYDYECYVILKDDGTGTLAMEGKLEDICWDETKLWSPGDEEGYVEFTVDGENLSLEMDGVTLTFTLGQIPSAPAKEEESEGDVVFGEDATTYRLSSATIEGETLGKQELSLLGLSSASCYVVLAPDGTGLLCLMGDSSQIAWEGTKLWDPADETDVMEFTLSGNDLSIVVEDMTLTFTAGTVTAARGDRYALVSAEMEGEKFSGEELALLGMTGEDCYLELCEDGTGVLALLGENTDIQWEDGKLWMAGFTEETISFTQNGDEITIDMEGLILTLKKG